MVGDLASAIGSKGPLDEDAAPDAGTEFDSGFALLGGPSKDELRSSPFCVCALGSVSIVTTSGKARGGDATSGGKAKVGGTSGVP